MKTVSFYLQWYKAQSRYNPYLFFQVAALVTLLLVIVINLAVGILPNVDNFAHLGGFITGFLIGFVFLIRPQFGWVSQRYITREYSATLTKSKFRMYQRVLWVISLILVILWWVPKTWSSYIQWKDSFLFTHTRLHEAKLCR